MIATAPAHPSDPTTGPSAHHTTGAPGHGTRRPTRLRRVLLGVAGLVACALPTVFAVSITTMLVTGEAADHRFHQLTGQGLLLVALWLGGLVPLLVAALRGRRPSTAAGVQHLALVLSGVALAVAAPGGGAPVLMGVIAVTGALVWLALPQAPRLKRLRVRLDPVLAPVALLAAGFLVTFAVGQLALQNAATGYHAENPHHFDMAWVSVVLTVLAVAAALLPQARHLVRWTAAGLVVLGTAGLGTGEPVVWSATAVALGLLTGAAAMWRSRLGDGTGAPTLRA